MVLLLFFYNDGFGIKYPAKVDMPLKQRKNEISKQLYTTGLHKS